MNVYDVDDDELIRERGKKVYWSQIDVPLKIVDKKLIRPPPPTSSAGIQMKLLL